MSELKSSLASLVLFSVAEAETLALSDTLALLPPELIRFNMMHVKKFVQHIRWKKNFIGLMRILSCSVNGKLFFMLLMLIRSINDMIYS